MHIYSAINSEELHLKIFFNFFPPEYLIILNNLFKIILQSKCLSFFSNK